MEFLVHNISHSDLIVELSRVKELPKPGGDHSAAFSPAENAFGSSNLTSSSPTRKDEAGGVQSVLARPKFSLFQQISRVIMDRVEELRASSARLSLVGSSTPNSDGSRSPLTSGAASAATPANAFGPHLNPSLLDIMPEHPKKRSRSFVWKARCQDTQSPIGFKLDQCGIPVTDIQDFQIRGGLEVVQEIENKWEHVMITAVYFPLIALLLPKWIQVLKEFQSESSKQIVYLISGAGIPRNVSHSIHGNSTEITAKLITLFIHQYYPHMEVFQVHSGSNIFRYDDNVQFMTRELRPRIEAHRETVVARCGESWKSHFHVTIAYTDGTPARLSALNASLRIYRPSYLHIWQLKTFWHERKLAMDDVDFHSFENIEASPCVAFPQADKLTQKLIKEMRVFRDEFLQAVDKGEVASFWLRKSRKPVLAILLIEKEVEEQVPISAVGATGATTATATTGSGQCSTPTSSSIASNGKTISVETLATTTTSQGMQLVRKKKLVVVRGMNCEVSMPTGSLCAERNAIGSALAMDPTLRRKSMKMIGVLGLNLDRPKKANDTTVATTTTSTFTTSHPSNATVCNGSCTTGTPTSTASGNAATSALFADIPLVQVTKRPPKETFGAPTSSGAGNVGGQDQATPAGIASPLSPPKRASPELGSPSPTASVTDSKPTTIALQPTQSGTTISGQGTVAKVHNETPDSAQSDMSMAQQASTAAIGTTPTKRSPRSDSEPNSNYVSPRKPKRPRTYSCDDNSIENQEDSMDRNPLAPCGACKEWLLKVAEANPSFRVVTFENARCRSVYINQIM